MRFTQLMTSLINRIIAFYEANADTKSRKRALLLKKMSWLSEVILVGGLIGYMHCAILHLINPIYGYFWQHEFKPLFPLYIPFVDEQTTAGFIILILIQTMEISLALGTSAGADFHFMITVINVWIFSSSFKENFYALNGILREESVDMPLAKTKLRNIYEMYYDIWTYVCFGIT